MFADSLRSDHAPFWKESIPTLFISDTANFRSELYHTPGDTHDKINYEALEKFTLLMYDVLKTTS
jgi:Zn-dependent M28 family amino/carboxypeptidase